MSEVALEEETAAPECAFCVDKEQALKDLDKYGVNVCEGCFKELWGAECNTLLQDKIIRMGGEEGSE